MRILLIEDDHNLGESIVDQLSIMGHSVDWAQSLEYGNDLIAVQIYDLVLLDLMLPDGNGIDFLKATRQAGNAVPVIIMTALNQITKRIEGLNEGADDFLNKPVEFEELAARIGAVTRRYGGKPSPLFHLNELNVDVATRKLTKYDAEIELTAKEWVLLEAFISRPDQYFSKSALEEKLYAFDNEVEGNAIEVYISRLRKKIGKENIITSRGLGYKLGRHETH